MTGGWLLGTTLRRTKAQWRLLAAVIVVAMLAASLVTSLGLLVTATEQGGVRGALAEIPDEQSLISVRAIRPATAVDRARETMDAAIAEVIGDSGSATGVGMVRSLVIPAPELDAEVPALGYLGDLDGITENASLVEGEWATTGDGDSAPVTIPESSATALGLAVGDEFTFDDSVDVLTVRVVGIYVADDAKSDFWDRDLLHGRGNDPAFPRPDVGFYDPTNMFGPLIVAPGSLDALGVSIAFLDVEYLPTFDVATVEGIEPLLTRLADADISVPLTVESGSNGVFYSTRVADAIGSIASSLVVTRSTVVVVGLLLVVLALAAMAQTARLFVDARAGERQLMRSRGAALRHVLGLAAFEAVVIGVITAVASPLLASLVYRALAAQPPMVAAGMPADAGMPPITWITAAAIGLAFIAVLVLPLLGRERTFVDGEQAKGRPRRASGIARSGIDVVFVILAAVAVWQLQSYRTPVTDGVSLAIDPVLAAGPALVLVAAGFVCVRLIPAASRLVERLGESSRGVGLALSAWEVGRRPQRATAAVLLLSLTLAVGTFGVSFLDTWKRSQLDQAFVASGAPVRAALDVEKLTDGAIGAPQPALRRSGTIGYNPAQSVGVDPYPAKILGVTADARSWLTRDRVGAEGGSVIAGELDPVDPLVGIAAPEEVTVRLAPAVANVSADVRVIVSSSEGVIRIVSLSVVPVDGQEVTLPLALEAGEQVVGVQAVLLGKGETEAALLDMTVSGLEAARGWFGATNQYASDLPEVTDATGDAPLTLSFVLPDNVENQYIVVSAVEWERTASIPAVSTRTLLDDSLLDTDIGLVMQTSGALVPITVIDVAPLIPGAVSLADLVAGTTGLSGVATATDTIVVDQDLLARSLAEGGSDGALADEWWVDVAPGDGARYAAAHKGAISAEVLGQRLQEAPLRVATQAALWLAIITGALLAAVGFAAHSTATLRARRLELAQLRAIGFSRSRLVGLVGGESLLMAGLGTVFGVAIGLLLVWLIGPLVAVSPDGSETVPAVVVHIPWLAILVLVAEMIAVLALVVLVVARVQRFAEPAELLREGAAS